MVERRRRSPSVPFIGLAPAEVHARNLYDRVERAWVSVADAAAVWGMSPKKPLDEAKRAGFESAIWRRVSWPILG